MGSESIKVEKGNPGDVVTIRYADHTEDHLMYMPGHSFCDSFGSDDVMAIPGFFYPDSPITSIEFRRLTNDEGLNKVNDVDKVNDSIRRLLDGPDHDEIMRKVVLAKEARNYGARLRGTEPNDCPAVYPLHLSSPHT